MVPPRRSVAFERRESVVMRIVLIFLLLCSPALAHDPSHPELNEWFNGLASGRGLCCSFADGFAVSDVDWESKDGHYRVRLENIWIDVPDDALITEPNRVGRTMVWPLRFDGQILIRCFMPGSMGYGAGLRSRAHSADNSLEPSASTLWVSLLLISGPA